MAFTQFNGYRYCATQEQVDKADTYIIDPAGIEDFYQKYNGEKTVVCIELLASWRARYKRMRSRGDSILKTISRLLHDRKAFEDVSALSWVDTEDIDIEHVVRRIMALIEILGRFDKPQRERFIKYKWMRNR